jgi:HlyD family secretion protein
MKKWITILVVIVAVAGSAGAYYKFRGPEGEVKVTTLPVSRGEIVETVGATGTLQAVTTVQVGSQVSGNIKALFADFNSIVKKGQIVAELDPSLIQTQIEQAQANLTRSLSDVERLRVSAEDARNKLKRTQSLFDRKLVSQQELEAAQVAVRAADAQLKSSEAGTVQSQASLNQSEVNLRHTVIQAPIDGIVISRNVDVGQTVAASMNAPVLFIIAADLTKMQVNASVDESDVGRIRPGQHVRFRVDAYPTEEFTGTVAQVRLQPIVAQNVVTYATVIDVPNDQLKLKPGMTANVTIEIAKRSDVLRVPNAAIRFRPTTDTFAALNQAVPPEMQRGAAGFGGGQGRGQGAGQGPNVPGQPPGAAAPAAPAGAAAPAAQPPAARQAPRGGAAAPSATAPQGAPPSSAPGEGGRRTGGNQPAEGRPGGGFGGGGFANMTPEEREKRTQERMASMSPEERERFAQRMRDRGTNAANPAAGSPQAPGAGRPTHRTQGAEAAAANRPTPQTIDQLFGPLPVTESAGRGWLYSNSQLKSVRLRLGITDGTYTELLTSELQPGQELVTSVVTPAQAAAASTRSPLMPGGPGMGGRGVPSGGGRR